MSIKYNPIGFNPDEVYDEENPVPFILSNWTYQDQPQTFKQLMAERDKVKSEILGDAPTDLDSLKEIAASINNSAIFYQNVDSLLAEKAPTSNPVFTGVITTPQIEIDSMILEGEAVPASKLKRVKNLRTDVQQQLDDISSGATQFQAFSIGQPVSGSVLSITGNSNIGNSVDDVCRITGLTVCDTVQVLGLKVLSNVTIDATEISRLNGVSSNIQTQFGTVSDNISGLDTRLSTAEGEIDTLISRADDNDSNDTQRSNEISALQSDVSTLQGQMSTATSVNTSQASTLTSHTTSISTLTNGLTSANQMINGLGSDVFGLLAADVTHVNRLNAIETLNTTQNGRLDAIETLDITQSSNITSNSSAISTLNSSVATINSNVSTLTTRANGLDTSVSELNTALGTKQNLISSTNRLNANLLYDGSISNAELFCLDNCNGNIQNQIDGLLNNSNLTGIPTAPTAISSTNTTQVATTAFVKTQINNLIGGASSTLDTLYEIQQAINGDSQIANTLTTLIGTKAPLVNPTFSDGFNLNTNITANSIGITPTEISRLSGVSSNIQTALDGKQATITGSTNLTVGNLTTSSIVDNGALLCKGVVTIGDQVTDSVTFFSGMTVSGLTKSNVGLGNVDNKSASTIKGELLAADNTFSGTNTYSVLPLCSAAVANSNDLTNKTYVDTQVATKCDDSAAVKLTTNQTINGIKTLTSPPVMSGASISSATIPQTSVNGLATSLAAKQDTITGSTNLTIGNLTTTSIIDNGNATIKGNTVIGDSTLDSVTFYAGMSVSGLTKAHIGLSNVTNESKATMFSSPTFTGTVSGVTASHVGLGNVTNESKATMFESPTFTGTVTGVSATHVGLGNVTNESKATMFSSPTLTGTSSIASATFSGSLVSNQTVSLSEFVNPVSVSSSIATCNYATSAIHLVTPTAGNFTAALTNVNPNASTYRTYTVTLLIDATTNKVFSNALSVNGTSRTLIYNGGSSAIPTLTSATYIVQTISVIYGASNSVPICCVTNIAPFQA